MPTRLLNPSEEATYLRLTDVAVGHSARVFPKFRIADVLPINCSGISSELFHYGLAAHFDFVVADSDYTPLFAVEFDGPHHTESDVARARDKKKNSICDRFEFPLLRINSRHIDIKFRGMDLLSYFTNCWFLARGFFEAQEQGHIPCDEPFDPCMILSDGKQKQRWPYWLSLPEQIYIQNLQEAGKIVHPCTSEWTGLDDDGNYRCVAWLQVAKDAFVMARTGMRSQQFPIYETDVLQQIAVFDIRREIDRHLAGESNTVPGSVIDATVKQYEQAYEMMAYGGIGQIK